MNEDRMKWIGALLAGAGWFTLVLLDKASADSFVQFVQYLVVGLGAHGLSKRAAP